MASQRDSSPRGYTRRRRRGYEINDRQSFIDILGTVLKYVLIIVLIMVMVRVAREAYNIGYTAFSEEAMAARGEGTEVTVEITQDMSVRDIGELLAANGLIKDARVFPIQERLSSYHGEIMPGTYTLSTEMTPDEILATLAQNYTDEDADTSDTSESTDSSSADTTDTQS